MSKFLDGLKRLAVKARPYIPFTALNTVWRRLNKRGKSILDLGCGRGEPMSFINRNNQFYTVGLDIFEPYLKECQKHRIHNEYCQGDVCKLPFRDKSFDIVLCMELLEHLDKINGEKLLGEAERVAKKQIILSTPVGPSEQDELLLQDGNVFQVHKSSWQPSELKNLGYKKIKGSTLHCFAGRAVTISFPVEALRPLGYLLWLLKMKEFEKVWEGLNFAFLKYVGLKRKVGDVPYVIHPIRVAMILRAAGCSEFENRDLILAAYFHDLLEDTDLTYEELKTEFGKDVALIVKELSKPDTISNEDWLRAFENSSKEAKLIKMADRIDNLMDMKLPEWDVEKQKVYAEQGLIILETCGKTSPKLANMLKKLINKILNDL